MARFVSLKADGFEGVIAQARAQKKSIRKALSKNLTATALQIVDWTNELFDDSESEELFFKGSRGVFWPDRRGEEDYDHPKLIDTGSLRSSIRYRTRIRNRGRGRWYATADVYSDAERAHYGWRHQYGDPANRVPSRPFLFLSAQESDFIEDVLQSSVIGRTRRARGKGVRI